MAELYTITEQYHEKKGTYIYVLRLIKKVDKDEFINLRECAKDYDGYYSSYRGVNGFVFQTEEDAESFGTILDSFFDTSSIQDVVDEKIEEDIEEVITPKKTRKRPRINSTAIESEKSTDSTQISAGMPLHIALRNVIQTDGKSIITESRLVNILDDFHAYDVIPASKYILRVVIAEGYSSKLLIIGKWDNKAQQLSDKFASITGFIPGNVNSIFESIAYGLGWINTFSALPNPSNTPSSTPQTTSHTTSSKSSSPVLKKWSKKWMKKKQSNFFFQ